MDDRLVNILCMHIYSEIISITVKKIHSRVKRVYILASELDYKVRY